MAVIYLNEKDFEEQVVNAGKMVMVDFYADWCGPCKMMGPIVDSLAEEFSDIKVCKVNVDENQELAMSAGVSSIPAFCFYKDGEMKKKVVGAVPRSELITAINEYK